MLEVIIALSLAILLGNILAHKIRITPAILLIFLGLVLALIPVHAMHEVREVGLPPHVILEIFLPIMLFWETRNTSWREARARLRGILLSGTVLVIFTAFVIAWVLHTFMGVYLWHVALIIGVALAPPMLWPWQRSTANSPNLPSPPLKRKHSLTTAPP